MSRSIKKSANEVFQTLQWLVWQRASFSIAVAQDSEFFTIAKQHKSEELALNNIG